MLRQIDPAHKVELTLFHEYQSRYESLGLQNQDTGDVFGDCYFVLRGLLLPIECASSAAPPPVDCTNPEQTGAHNIISRLSVMVDDRFGPYGACNVDRASGQYRCECGSWRHPVVCPAAVGRTDVAQRELREHRLNVSSPDWSWWRLNLAVKMSGFWYSTTEAGRCHDDMLHSNHSNHSSRSGRSNRASPAGFSGDTHGNCTWSLSANQRHIEAACLETRIAETVRSQRPGCFARCEQPQNASTPCVARCYMETILGPNASSRVVNASEGMRRELITQAWERAFASAQPAAGGCPDADFVSREMVREGQGGNDSRNAATRPHDQAGSRVSWPLAWSSRLSG